MNTDYKDVPLRQFGDDVMHTVNIDEGQRQMILLALGELCTDRPGWDYALGNLAECFQPDGREMYEYFRDLDARMVLESIGTIGEKTP